MANTIAGKIKVKVEPDENEDNAVSVVQREQSKNTLPEESKSSADIILLHAELKHHKKSIASLNTQNESLLNQLKEAKTELKFIRNENAQLTAIVDQLRKGNKQKCEHEHKKNKKNQKSDPNVANDTDDNDVFDVENILQHRNKGLKREFLVKWSGYDISHNSWVVENDLNCPELLKEYLSKREH